MAMKLLTNPILPGLVCALALSTTVPGFFGPSAATQPAGTSVGATTTTALAAEPCVAPASASAAGAAEAAHDHDMHPSRTGIAAIDLFTGDGAYIPRTHCIVTPDGKADTPWIVTLLVLTAAVIVAYLRIFVFWMRSYYREAPQDRNSKLFDLAAIFLFCAICGYAMSIVMFVWPAYRLLAVFLLVLNVFSWRFSLNLKPFEQAFAAGRLERELRESLQSRARELERQVELRTAELAQRTTESHRLAEIARRTANAVVITDSLGRVEWVNEGFTRMTGFGLDEVKGRPPGHVLQGELSDPAEVQRMRDAIREGRSVTAELFNYSKSGVRYRVRVEIDPLHDAVTGAITGFMAIETDVTEQYENRAELERRALELSALRDAADAANHAKSEFLANMSHEIRTPMTAILGFTDLLAELTDDAANRGADSQEIDAAKNGYVDAIRRNGQHLLAIINDILDLSKIEAGKMTLERINVDVHAMVANVETIMRGQAEARGVRLRFESIGPVPESIDTDPVRAKQALVNLIGNAIKFTQPGGSVTVRIQSVDAPTGRPADQNGPPAKLLKFDVCDTGIGMTSEQMARLFRAFEQADASTTRRFGGTGLGLRISRQLARLLGGDIVVASEVGKGSIFTLTIASECTAQASVASARVGDALDAAADGVEPMVATPSPRRDLVGRDLAGRGTASMAGLRVLVAEDGPDNRALIAFLLRRVGAVVVTVEDGEAAIAKLCESTSAGFDLLVTDMQMPVMDGYDLARTLRSMGNPIPIVALTAHAMRGDSDRCLEAGCDAYASKPIDMPVLLEACQKACRAAEARRPSRRAA